MNFMAVTARQSPDFRTISDFRKRHLPALGGLFTQVLQLCQQTGLVSLEPRRVRWDATGPVRRHPAKPAGEPGVSSADFKATFLASVAMALEKQQFLFAIKRKCA